MHSMRQLLPMALTGPESVIACLSCGGRLHRREHPEVKRLRNGAVARPAGPGVQFILEEVTTSNLRSRLYSYQLG